MSHGCWEAYGAYELPSLTANDFSAKTQHMWPRGPLTANVSRQIIERIGEPLISQGFGLHTINIPKVNYIFQNLFCIGELWSIQKKTTGLHRYL